jgi:hypothetical protein
MLREENCCRRISGRLLIGFGNSFSKAGYMQAGGNLL